MPLEPGPFALVAALLLVSGAALACLRPALVVDHPRAVLALIGAVTIAALGVLVRLDPQTGRPGFTIDVDPASEPLIARDDPGIPRYWDAVRDFGNDDVYVVVMETDGVFAREHLETLHALTHGIRALPGVAEVESLARVLDTVWDPELDSLTVAHLFDDVPATDEEIAALRARALADPIYRKTLVSEDGRSAAINVTFQPMTDGEFVALDLDGRIAELVEAETRADRHFYVAGRPHVRAQAYHLMVGDMARLVPIAVAVAAVVLWTMVGSLVGMLLPLVACLTATLWVFGALAALQIDINLITLVLASMLICVGSVYGVHVLARYEVIAAERAAAGAPDDARSVALACLCYARTPVLMAGFTTCIGFGALLLTEIPATNELGAFSILGVASVSVISLSGVPAALVLFGAPLRRRASSGAPGGAARRIATRLDRALHAIADLAVDRSGSVLAASAVACGLAAVLVPRIAIDTDVITFFQRDSRVRTDFARVNDLVAGAVPIYVSIDGGAEGAFRDPANLRAIARLQERLEAVEGVSQVLSSVDLVRRVNRSLHREEPAQYRIPDTRAAVAEATFLLPKSRLRRFANSNHARVNLIVRSGRSGSAAVRALEERLLAELAAFPLPEGFRTQVTGNAILINRSADGIAGNQATQVGFAAGTIFGLICIVFRSLRIAAISMVPNVVPVALFFAVLGIGVAPLSLPTSLIGSIALGIAIDDTMHFVVAYRTRRAAGLSPDRAARECILQVGRPIVMTSIMLVVGFLVILASGFATLQEFGALTALTMALCLVTDLVLLPALLVRSRA